MLDNHIKVIPDFYKRADEMRAFYEKCFANPMEATEMRFVWDYWNVEGQYSLMRTPAYHYFPEELYNHFHESLVNWGRKNLGCFDVSPPWLSYYTDGCYQNWHADTPHGPWAFVFSLTPWENRNFKGGETQILKPEILNFWQNFSSDRGLEEPDIIKYIPSEFNKLTLFDPRFPHGVRRVSGTRDPREARLVIHGWFTEPRPFIDGYTGDDDIELILNDRIDLIFGEKDIPNITGVLVYKFNITSNGEISALATTMNNLISIENKNIELKNFIAELYSAAQKLTFPKNKDAYEITLPLMFDQDG